MADFFKFLRGLFFGFLAVICLGLILPLFPFAGNFKILAVLSGSMEPAIHIGSIVVVKPMPEYRAGQVVTFGEISQNKTPITHRIYAVEKENGQDVFTTKGDANNAPDNRKIYFSEIKGKAIYSIPYLGYVLNFMRRPEVFFIFIAAPAVVIIWEESKKIGREIAKSKKSKNV